MRDELSCSEDFAEANVRDFIAILRQVAALITAGALSGTCPVAADRSAHAVVTKEPLGVILGIAPRSAPLFLGFRAAAAPIAAGNTAILKVRIVCTYPSTRVPGRGLTRSHRVRN